MSSTLDKAANNVPELVPTKPRSALRVANVCTSGTPVAAVFFYKTDAVGTSAILANVTLIRYFEVIIANRYIHCLISPSLPVSTNLVEPFVSVLTHYTK
jgi:hypothetical protein